MARRPPRPWQDDRRDRGTDSLSRLDRRDHRDRRYRCAATVDIVGRHERAACTVRAAAVSVRRRRTMPNQVRVAAHPKEARRELLQTARGRKNQNP